MKSKLMILLFLSCSIFSFSQRLFMPKATNNDFENNITVQKIINRAATNSVTEIDLDIEQIVQQQSITFTIDNTTYTLFPITTDVRGVNNFTITYRSEDNNKNNMVLSVYGEDITGYLFLEDGIYSIETYNTNQYVLVSIDQSAFPEENDEFEMTLFGEDEIEREVNDVNMVDITPHPVISVLVLYTNDAYENHPNVVNQVYSAEAMANLAFSNSEIDCKLKVVYIGSTDYDEPTPYSKSNFITNLYRFKNGSDGYMDEVDSLRNQYAADICVLICNNPMYCGVAPGLKLNADQAYCVVSHNCASSYLSFAHEIGHIIGCNHDLITNPETDQYQYNHGYVSENNNWRTVMSYNVCGGCTRIPYWSNPEVSYSGEAMGNTTYCDNARVWYERAETVSYFRNATYDTLTATSFDVLNADYAHMFAHHILTTSGSNVTIKSGSKVTFQAGDRIYLMPGFHAESGSYFHAYISDYDSAATHYTYTPLSMPRRHETSNNEVTNAEVMKMIVSPNPVNATSIVNVALDRDYDNFSIDVIDLYGRNIKNITAANTLQSGNYSYPLGSDELPKGIMFVVLSSNNQLLSTIKITKQ